VELAKDSGRVTGAEVTADAQRLTCLFVVTLASVFLLTGGAPEVQSAPRPNILFILTDDLNTRTYERAMPRTQALIERKGIRFDNATYSMSSCCPSRVSILRGQYPHNTGVWKNEPPNGGFETFKKRGLNNDTYATRINRVGYNTAYFGKYMNGYPKRGDLSSEARYYVPPGWDTWLGSTKNITDSHFINRRGQAHNPKPPHDVVVGDRAAAWLRAAARSNTPFLGAINFLAPHAPAWYPKGYRNRFASEPLPSPPSFNERNLSDKPPSVRRNDLISGREKRKLTRWHRMRLRSAAYADARIGQLMGILEASGELNNTYVFFYSDNGYHMGEHRLPSHTGGGKAFAYIEDIRFPILVRGPGIDKGQTSEAMVQNLDLRPTFEDIADATTPGYVDGASMLPTATDGATFPRDFAYAEKLGRDSWRAVYTAETAYHNTEGFVEFYDLIRDRHQLDGRIDTLEEPLVPTHREALADMSGCKAADCRSSVSP
jgi:N-acetylglucosamine-6-sulfatase